ncbi:MAG: hypothetical protein K5681_10295 [Treponema sp.]|nr:hypothetical protein [Treponema sp.]
MGREIELKIPVTYEQYNFIHDVILGMTFADDVKVLHGGVKSIEKRDEYYSRYKTREESRAAGEPQVIRIRTEVYGADSIDGANSSKAFFCIKRKTLENGVELNREDETLVENPDVIRDILNLSGYHKFFEKKKKALSVNCSSSILSGVTFHVELEVVNGLKYIEVEVTEEGVLADQVRHALERFVCFFGLDPSKRDSRSWMEILSSKQK